MTYDLLIYFCWMCLVAFAIVSVIILVNSIQQMVAIIKGRARKPKRPAMEEQQRQFLEAALEKEEEGKALPPYSWEEYRRDLEDGKLTFNHIWEKCGGVIPKKPEPRPGEPPPNEINSERMQWFKRMAETAFPVKIVSPPAPVAVIVVNKGYTELCRKCSVGPHARSTRERGVCSACGGKGFVVITGG